MVPDVRRALHTVPEVDTVVSKVGRPDDGMDPKIFNSAELYVGLKPEDQWRRGKSKDDLVAEMDAAVSAMPGFEPSFDQPIRDNVLESISQVDGQIVIKVRGDDLDSINATGRKILARISDVPGVARAFIDRDGSLPQFLIDVDRAARLAQDRSRRRKRASRFCSRCWESRVIEFEAPKRRSVPCA